MGPINWWDKAADWAWTAFAALFVLGGGAIVKLWRHEERIKTLEKGNDARTKQLDELSRKIDNNQNIVLAGINALREEQRGDHRMVVSKLLDKVPHA